jgi:hypothetical protein
MQQVTISNFTAVKAQRQTRRDPRATGFYGVRGVIQKYLA